MDQVPLEILLTAASIVVAVLVEVRNEIRDRRARRSRELRWGAWRLKQWSMADPDDPARNTKEEGLIVRPTVTRVAVWNAGSETIRASDVSPTHPFRIVGRGDVAILDARLIRDNGAGSRLRVSASGVDAALLFDYLRPQVGGLIHVTHVGRNEGDIEIVGELIEGAPIKRVPFPNLAWHAFIPRSIRARLGDVRSHRLFVLFDIFTSYLAIYYAYVITGIEEQGGLWQPLYWIMLVTQFVLQTLTAAFFLRGWRVDVPESLRPFDLSEAPNP